MADLIKIVERFEKAGASCKSSNHLKARKGRRPIRVDTLLKKKESSQSGADLRSPLMGGTKFPTQDSGISDAEKKLKKRQNIGVPQDPKSVGLKDLVPRYSVDSMPQMKVGSDMNIADDPLIQYLKKQASNDQVITGDWPKGDRKLEKGELVDTASHATPTGKSETPKVDGDPTVTKEMCSSGLSEAKSTLSENFDNKGGFRQKGKDKDHPHKAGTVDRIAKRG